MKSKKEFKTREKKKSEWRVKIIIGEKTLERKLERIQIRFY
jgi:hypothetical protein